MACRGGRRVGRDVREHAGAAVGAKVFPDKIDMLGLPYKKAYESAVAMLEALSGGG